MKIIHIAQMIQGGLASYLNELLPFQRRELDTVLLVIPADEIGYIDSSDPALFRPVSTRGRKVTSLLMFMVRTIRIIRAERPDVIHLHSTFAGALIRLWFLLFPWGRPRIVYCAHGWAFNMQVGEPMRRVYAAAERVFARVTDAIVCISGYEYDQAVRRGLPPALLHRIPNGIRDKPVRRGHGNDVFDPKTLNLLFVGRQDRQKGFDVLIDAMRSLESRAITLHVVGDAVVSAPRDDGDARPNVVQHGWKSRDEVEAFLADADALVMPSRWEGFGLVALEAMRQELPVCASDVDALPELVRDGVSGYLFPPDDAVALSRLLGDLDQGTLQRIGPRAREWYLDNFTSGRMNRDLMALYRTLVPPRRPATGTAGQCPATGTAGQ